VATHTAFALVDIATRQTERWKWDDARRWLGSGVLKKEGHNLH
jgi:hypothetical protein